MVSKMAKIPIKIKKEALGEKINDKLKVDLRQPKIAPKQKKQRLGLKFGALILAAAILVFSANWFLNLSREQPALMKIIPPEAIIVGLIDKYALYNQTQSFHPIFQEQWPFYKWLLNEIDRYLNQAGLDFQNDIQPLFKKQLALAVFPGNDHNQSTFSFIVILQKEAALTQINQALNRLEQELKNDFYLSSRTYRQIQINNLKPLSRAASNYYYGQIEKYLLISDSLNWTEKTIDLIIKK